MQPDAQKAYVFDEPLTTPTLTTKSGATTTTATTAGSPTTSTRTTSEGEACNGRVTDCVNGASEAPSAATPSSSGGGFALLYVTEVSISLSQKSEISEEEKEQVCSYIGAAVSEAPLEQSGNDQQPNLKENLLNVKVTGFFKK